MDKFNWFCHTWNHMQPHLYNNETHLEYEMLLNKAFAQVGMVNDITYNNCCVRSLQFLMVFFFNLDKLLFLEKFRILGDIFSILYLTYRNWFINSLSNHRRTGYRQTPATRWHPTIPAFIQYTNCCTPFGKRSGISEWLQPKSILTWGPPG